MSDTDDSAQTSPRPFAWDRLPEELQLELLFNLDYYELKEVQAVSKNFREFVKSKQFDKPLFREAPRPGLLTKRMRIELHPLLDGVDFFSSSQTSACYRTMNYESNAFEYAAVKEYATSPACSRMSFRFNHRDFEDVDDPGILAVKSGITVKDVLDFLIAFWEKEIQAGWSRDWLYEKVERLLSAQTRQQDEGADCPAQILSLRFLRRHPPSDRLPPPLDTLRLVLAIYCYTNEACHS